ncbi:hypothetical protein U9M48_033018 [Paspalum notatum var. saurae]|uniref:Uncharacterized protein n=1 Tax=Paspalum notatum var. saurae TaxID=547442 RepID=A0AAQ3U6D5_PASNO
MAARDPHVPSPSGRDDGDPGGRRHDSRPPHPGGPVTGDAPPGGWVGRVEAFLGRPLPAEQDGKKKRTSGVPLRWIRQELGQCPEDADEDTINFHCRAWVLNIVFASTA